MFRRTFCNSVVAAVLVASSTPALAADFYVDPVGGAATGDGSQARPWARLADVIAAGHIETRRYDTRPWVAGAGYVTINAGAAVKAGDTLWLASGNHGAVELREALNPQAINVFALPGHSPQLSRLTLVSVAQWNFRGITVSPSFGSVGYDGAIVQVLSHNFTGPSGQVTLTDAHVFSTQNTAAWDVLGWETEPNTGVDSDGSDFTVHNSLIENVFHGVMLRGPAGVASHNDIDGFGGDGIRVLGDASVVEFNDIRNAFGGTNPAIHNHDDGIQSWSIGADRRAGTGVVTNVIIRNNLIVHLDDPNSAVRGSYFQGIGNFDGFYDNFHISNNVVVADASHGITLTGTRDSTIINNTIMSTDAGAPAIPANGVPSVQIRNHKDGRPSLRNLVRNNIAHGYSLVPNTTADNNITVLFTSNEHQSLFVDPALGDYRLLPATRVVDTASSLAAPATDILSQVRPFGMGFDHGAHEYRDVPPVSPEIPGRLPPPGVDPDAGSLDAPADAGNPMDAADSGTPSLDGSPMPETGPPDSGPDDAGMADAEDAADQGAADQGSADVSVGPDSAVAMDSGGAVDADTRDMGPADDGTRVINPSDCSCHSTRPERGLVGTFLFVLLAVRRRKPEQFRRTAD